MKRLLILSLLLFSGPAFVNAGGADADGMASRAAEVAALAMAESAQEEVEKCAVCLEVLNSQPTISAGQCKHHFHKDCLHGWAKQHKNCPLCRGDLSKDSLKEMGIEQAAIRAYSMTPAAIARRRRFVSGIEDLFNPEQQQADPLNRRIFDLLGRELPVLAPPIERAVGSVSERNQALLSRAEQMRQEELEAIEAAQAVVPAEYDVPFDLQ